MASANQRLSALLPSWSVTTSPSSLHSQSLHIDLVTSNNTTPAPSLDQKKVRFVALSPFGSKYHDRRPQSYHHPARSEEEDSSSPGSESFDTDQQSSGPTTPKQSLPVAFEALRATRTEEDRKFANEQQPTVTIYQTDADYQSSDLTSTEASSNMASNPANFYDSDDPSGGRPNLGVEPEIEPEVAQVLFNDRGRRMINSVPALRYDAPPRPHLGPPAFTFEQHVAAGAMVSPSSSSSAGVDNGLSMRERLTRNTRRMLHGVGHAPPRPRRSSQRPVTADAVFQVAHGTAVPGMGETAPRPPILSAPSPHPVAFLEMRPNIDPPLGPQLQATSQTTLVVPISPFDLQNPHPGSRRGSTPLSDASSRWTYGTVPSREDVLSLSSFVSDGDARHPTATLAYLTEHLQPPRRVSQTAIDDFQETTPRRPSSTRIPVPREPQVSVPSVTTAVAAGHFGMETVDNGSSPSSATQNAGVSAVEPSRVSKGFAFFGGGSISRKKGEGFTDQPSSINPDERHAYTQDASSGPSEATPRRRLSQFRSKPNTLDRTPIFGTRRSSGASSSRDEGIQRSDRMDSNDDTFYAPIARASVISIPADRQRLQFGSLSSAGTGSLQSWSHNPLVTTFTRSSQRGSDAQEAEEVLTPKSTYSPSPLPEESAEPFESSPYPTGQPGMTSLASSSQEALLDARYNSQLDLGPDQDIHGTPSGKEGLPTSVTEATMSTASQQPSFHSFRSDSPLVEPEISLSATVHATQHSVPLESSAADKLVAATQQFKRVVTRERKDRYSVAMPESYLNYDPNPDPDGILGILDDTPKTGSTTSTPKYAEIPLASGTPIDIRPAPLSIHQLIEERAKPVVVTGANKRSDLLQKLIAKRNPPVGLNIIIPLEPDDPTFASGKTAPVVHRTMQAKIQAPMDRITDRKCKESKMDAKESLRMQKDAILKELAEKKPSEEGQPQQHNPSQISVRKSPSVDNDTAQHGLRTFQDTGSSSRPARRSRPQTAPTSTDSYYVQHPDIPSSKSPNDSPVIPLDTPKRRGLIRRMFSKEGLIRQLGLEKFGKSKGKATQSALTPAETMRESYEAQEARLLATAEEMATPVRESFNLHLLQQRLSGQHFMSESASASSMIPLASKTAPASTQSMYTAESDIARDESVAPPSPARTSSDIAGQDMSSITSSIPKKTSHDGSHILAPSPRRPVRSLSRLQSSSSKDQTGRLPATPTKTRPAGDAVPLTERPIDTITEEGNSRLSALNHPDLNVYSSVTIARVLSGGKRDLHKSVIAKDSGGSASDSSSADAKEIALLQERLLQAQARREERRLQKEALRARLAIESDDDREMRDPNVKPCERCGCTCASTSKRRDKGKQREV